MSVGVSIPSKQDNFTLQASWAFNMACTHKKVDSLEKSGYGEPLFLWQYFHTSIGCVATAAWRAPPVFKFGTASFFTSICHIFQLYLLILAFAFAAQPASAISVKLCRNLVDESSSQIHFSLYLYQFVTVFLAYGVVNLLASHLRPPVQMMWVFLRGQNNAIFQVCWQL